MGLVYIYLKTIYCSLFILGELIWMTIVLSQSMTNKIALSPSLLRLS